MLSCLWDNVYVCWSMGVIVRSFLLRTVISSIYAITFKSYCPALDKLFNLFDSVSLSAKWEL